MNAHHFLTSFFALVGFLAIAAHARTFPESPRHKFELIITYVKALNLPTNRDVTSISTASEDQSQFNDFTLETNYERTLNSPPPPPKSAPPTHQVTTVSKSPPPPPRSSPPPIQDKIISPPDCVESGSVCKGAISMITDYKRPAKYPPPPPQPSSPNEELTSDEQIAYRRSPPDFYLASS